MLDNNRAKHNIFISKLFRDKVFLISSVFFLLIVIIALFAPLISPYGVNEMNIRNRLAKPFFLEGGSFDYIFGTDGLGRDIFTRILFGLRNSLLIAFLSVVIIFGIGIIAGLLSGIGGKKIDNLIMAMVDIQLSLPILVVAVILLAMTTPTIFTITIVLGVCGWPAYARSTRATVLVENKKDYIVAAKMMGAKTFWIIKRYFIKTVILKALPFFVLEFGLMIIWESLLSFIGIGIQPPNVSLGTIMGDGIIYLINAWWVTTIPGFFIIMITVSLSFINRRLTLILTQ